jgi:alpha-ketoglutarate-dependent taurine dioxygenase
MVEPIVPETVETARPSSLSRKFGLRPLPLHTDTAHWTVPCRYLGLACLDTGPTATPTFLLDSWAAQLSESESLLCRSAVFAIRNGRRSFYGSIMETDRPFIRLDPGCMMALSSEGDVALEAFNIQRHTSVLHRQDWKAGDILVVDNWRVLHARGYDAPTARGRILIRTMIR